MEVPQMPENGPPEGFARSSRLFPCFIRSSTEDWLPKNCSTNRFSETATLLIGSGLPDGSSLKASHRAGMLSAR